MNENLIDPAGDVRAGEEVDLAKVTAYLQGVGMKLDGEPRVKQFPGGASNLTYLLSYGEQDLILRRPPFGHIAKSAHDVVREAQIMKALKPVYPAVPDVYAIIPDAAALPVAIQTLQTLRAVGVSAQMHAGTGEGMGSMKSQFKKADASGAAFGLIFGADELARGEVTVKALRDGQGAQRLERLDAVAAWAQTLQSN